MECLNDLQVKVIESCVFALVRSVPCPTLECDDCVYNRVYDPINHYRRCLLVQTSNQLQEILSIGRGERID